MEEKKLFLLDAYALIYRAYYALINSPRVTSKGFNTSAIFGFCNTLRDVLNKENPGYIAVCFDPAGGHTFRHDAYPDYKAQRDKQPEDITLALPYIRRILNAYRIPAIEVPGYEADDVIGTLSRMAQAEDFTTYMMTPDKDYGQLVTDRVLMYRPSLRGQGFEIRGPQQVCERYGIERPEQVIDLLALEGDSSDNIPGCPGVGEKTAAKLIREWGSVDNLLDNIESLKGAMRAKVEANAEQIRFSKYLATIKTDVPLDIKPSDLRRAEPDVNALSEIFSELEFKQLAQQIGVKIVPAAAPSTEVRPHMASLFDDVEAEHGVPDVAVQERQIDISPRVATTPAEAAEWITMALIDPRLGISVEAPGDEAMRAPLQGVAVARADGSVFYIPVPADGDARSEILQILEPLFSSPSAILTSHDVKRDMVVLRRAGVEWTARYDDTAVAHYLLSPEMKHDLPTVAFAFLGHRTSDYELTATERKKVRILTDTEAAASAGERALLALRLADPLLDALKRDDLTKLYTDIEQPFVAVLAGMEWEGVRVSVPRLHELSRKLTTRLDELEQQAYALAGESFNVGSPTQVGKLLFEKMQIDPKARKTRRGAWSTTEEILEKYAKDHPIVHLILEIRGLRKLLTTYVDALPQLINPETHKIHTTFNQVATATGRISSTNPNLQNIPIRTEDGREIREAFEADPGCLILSADYSQIELRLIAAFSHDLEMMAAFRAGSDIHRATAAKIYHLAPEEVTDEQRRNAKTANFGIIYGISAFGLSERLGIPRSEAKLLMEGYLNTYPDVQAYMTRAIENAREQGYVTTAFGRKRYLPEINSRNAVLRGYAERNAINAPLQGSAADIIKVAMIDIDREIRARGYRSRMIIQVHDELIFNVFPDELDSLRAMVVERMAAAYNGPVPLEVSAGVGHNWLEAH